MLELYHHGSSVCAAKVRYALGEKNMEADKMHYIDVLAGDQFNPDYVKLNPKAVVPTLVHDGKVILESTVICEYLDDVFPDVSLIPDNAYDRAQMRLWTKAVDESLHPACGEFTFVCCHRHIVLRLPKEKLEEFLKNTPAQSVTNKWKERKKEIVRMGFDAPGIEHTIRLYDTYLHKMDETLKDKKWLAGDSFSLADVGLTPYVNRLDMLSMSGMWDNGRLPNVEDWFSQIKSRPPFKKAFLDWCPEDLTNDLREFGTQNWPSVKRIIGME